MPASKTGKPVSAAAVVTATAIPLATAVTGKLGANNEPANTAPAPMPQVSAVAWQSPAGASRDGEGESHVETIATVAAAKNSWNTKSAESAGSEHHSHAGLPRLRWQYNRLRQMDLPEIGWRVRQAVLIALVRWRCLRAGPGVLAPVPAANHTFGRSWLHNPGASFDGDPTVAAAERILAGRFDVFALPDADLGFPPHWNRDPKTGTVAPMRPGMAIDHRDPALVGDIKYLWEPNRHQELVTLAQAWYLTQENRHADGCRQLLDSWFTQVPHPLGQGWTSALENAIRLINWSFAWQLLGGGDSLLFSGEDGQDFRQRWLDCIYRHCAFVSAHRSLHSSANNHLVGEYAGLFVASHTWPCWPESMEWQRLSRQGLEAQVLAQVGADGVHREQATWYHHEVADMVLLCTLVANAHEQPLAPACRDRLEGMCACICSLRDAGGHVPMLGDADDARLRLSCERDFDPFQSLLASGAVLFGRADFAAKADHFDDKSRWLLGSAGEARFDQLRTDHANVGTPAASYPRRVFADAGIYVLGSDFDTAAEVRIVADAGALGYLSIAAHGHADALSLTLSAGGRPLLIDPGTYAYHLQQTWRSYFRGTSAHNTACIDDRDQSDMGGAFLWLRKAKAVAESWRSSAQEDMLTASHDGYLRLRDPVLHRRTIRYVKAERTLLVEDLFVCHGIHDITLHWHFSEQCRIRTNVGPGADTDACAVEAQREGVRLEAWMPDAAGRLELVRGRASPPLGWISHHLDCKQPSPTLAWKQSIDGTTRCVTRFRISFA